MTDPLQPQQPWTPGQPVSGQPAGGQPTPGHIPGQQPDVQPGQMPGQQPDVQPGQMPGQAPDGQAGFNPQQDGLSFGPTTPAAPGMPPPGMPPDGGFAGSPPPPEPPKKGGAALWIAGIAAVVILAGAAVFVWLTLGDDDSDDSADDGGTPEEEASDESSEEPQDEDPVETGELVVDPGTGFAYPQLPSPWNAPETFQGDDMAGSGYLSYTHQFVETDPVRAQWGASIAIGELDTDLIGFQAGGDVEAVALALAETNEQNFWGEEQPPAGYARGEYAVNEVELGGYTGVSVEYQLTWNEFDEMADTAESVLHVVFDLGDGRLAFGFASVPSLTPSEHVDQINSAIDSAQFTE